MRRRSLALLAFFLSTTASARIANISVFLNQCPQSDRAYEQIRQDFQIRRDGVPVADIPCSEPVSALPVNQYTDELVLVQGLRVAYHMDRELSGHLPWTSGALYDWMRSRIRGFNLSGSGSFCCTAFPDGLYVTLRLFDDFNREFDKGWRGIAGNIDLYAHEIRHTDGFPHTSCCGISNGCDESFDPENLSPYGIQWWLNDLWLRNVIDVGAGCLTAAEEEQLKQWFLAAVNSQYGPRFCTARPAEQGPPGIYPCSRRLRPARRRL